MFPLSHVCRRQQDVTLNTVQASSSASVNFANGWTGSTTFVLCAGFASTFQQRAGKATVHYFVSQARALRRLKWYGTSSVYIRTTETEAYDVSVLLFVDSARSVDYGQQCFICDIFIGNLDDMGIFHVIPQASRKCHRPVKSSGSAEILA